MLDELKQQNRRFADAHTQVGVNLSREFVRLRREARLAEQDDLTKLLNRRSFYRMAKQALRVFGRNGHPLSLVFIDLDNFKKINDDCGHQAGDELLKKFAGVMKKTLRKTDQGFRLSERQSFRLGGDEFAICLPETTEANAYKFLERLRVAAANQGVLFSAGVITVVSGDYDLRQVIQIADHRMYQEKRERKLQLLPA